MSKERMPLVTHIFTADPAAHVFEGKIYIYPSHDLPHEGEDDDDGGQYQMEDYHVLKMENVDAPCKDMGEALHVKDVPWAKKQMWAPDAAYKNGKYYLYFPAKDAEGVFRIGVAESDRPEGPFVPEESYIPGSYSIDPAVFTDEDGRSYLYFGGIWGGQLQRWRSGSYDGDMWLPEAEEPALCPMFAELSEDMKSFKEKPKMLQILDEEGNPILTKDEDRWFFEASWMHKYKGTYYLSYSTGSTHYIVYATGESPEGPFTYRGRILEPVEGWTTQHSIIEYEGKWYLFYHDSEFSGGVSHRRSVKFTELHYKEDGTIQTIDVRKKDSL